MSRSLDDCKQFLADEGVKSIKHSGRNLFEHLEQTYEILKAAQQPLPVCLAGLFHSIYGTSAFKKTAISKTRRDEVQQFIGVDAERWVWLFGELDRPQALRAFVRGDGEICRRDGSLVDREMHGQDLQVCAIVEAANLLDQQQLWRHAWLHDVARNSGVVNAQGMSARHAAPHNHRAVDAAVRQEWYRRFLRSTLLRKIAHLRETLLGENSGYVAMLNAAKSAEVQSFLSCVDATATDNPTITEDEYPFLCNLARSRGINLLQAAELLAQQCSFEQNAVMETELMKDRLEARLSLAVDMADLGHISQEIQALTLENFK